MPNNVNHELNHIYRVGISAMDAISITVYTLMPIYGSWYHTSTFEVKESSEPNKMVKHLQQSLLLIILVADYIQLCSQTKVQCESK